MKKIAGIIFRRIGSRIVPIKTSGGAISKALNRAKLNTPDVRKKLAKKIISLRREFRTNPNATKTISSIVGISKIGKTTKLTNKKFALLDNTFAVSVPKSGIPNLTKPGHGRVTSNPKAAYRAFRRGRIK